VIPLTLGSIAAITCGSLAGGDPSAAVTGEFVIDSRRVVPGGLFVAVAGERVDGHLFGAAALASGAVGVLGTRAVPGVPSVVVADVPAALASLARFVLSSLPSAVVAGITGSAGKTSTKDIAAQLVSRLGPTVAPAGSFNTEYGLPLTVLRSDLDTRYLVLEMSARGVGHIAYLCRVAPPSYGVVLNVGHAHAGEFGGLEQVAIAKGELVEALPASGVAILNADDPRVLAMAARTQARVLTFGYAPPAPAPAPAPAPGPGGTTTSVPMAPTGSAAAPTRPTSHADGAIGTRAPDFQAADVRLDGLGRARFTLLTPDGAAPVSLRVHGAHQVPNALAAAALAHSLGLGLDDIADGLSTVVARSRWRMEVSERADGVVIINDAYNANPESVRAALDALRHMARDGRAFAVLGYMAELGDTSQAAHFAAGSYAAEAGAATVIAVGDETAPVLDGARAISSWHGEALAVPDGPAALAALRDRLKPGDVVLVKASRAASLESVAAELLTEADR
jgi:UDP-N-acetylmuramoyl-tripeptide--D-alanyl-D-alanine ligase